MSGLFLLNSSVENGLLLFKSGVGILALSPSFIQVGKATLSFWEPPEIENKRKD